MAAQNPIRSQGDSRVEMWAARLAPPAEHGGVGRPSASSALLAGRSAIWGDADVSAAVGDMKLCAGSAADAEIQHRSCGRFRMRNQILVPLTL